MGIDRGTNGKCRDGNIRQEDEEQPAPFRTNTDSRTDTLFGRGNRTRLLDGTARASKRTLYVACHDWERDGPIFGTTRPDGRYHRYNAQEFVNSFEKIFATSNPNTAITFTADDNNNTGPLIVVLSRPKIAGTSSDGSTVMIEYTMTQSASQGEVALIEQFLEMSGSCSIFINCPHIAIISYLWLELHNRHHMVRSYRSNNCWIRIQSLSIYLCVVINK